MSEGATNRIEQIVGEIRARIARRTESHSIEPELASSSQQNVNVSAYRVQLRNSAAALARLDDAIAQSMERLGTCPPTPPTRRGRVGALVIQNLSKVLWWHSMQIRETVSFILRRNREQVVSYEKTHQILIEAMGECLRLSTGFDRIEGELIGLRSRINLLESNPEQPPSSDCSIQAATTVDDSLRQITEMQRRLSEEIARIDGQTREQQDGLEQIRLRTDTAIQPTVDVLLQEQLRHRTENAQRIQELERFFSAEINKLRQQIENGGKLTKSPEALASESSNGGNNSQTDSVPNSVAQLAIFIQSEIARMEDSIQMLRAASASTGDGTVVTEIERLNGAFTSINDKLSDLGLAAHKLRADVSAQHARLGQVLREVRRGQPSPEPPASSYFNEEEGSFHRLYVDFEDMFRGSRDEIRERQRPYVKVLREAGVGGSDSTIVDLGCGRGEWLEELRDQGLDGRGVDSNRAMLETCKSLGLNVVESEAIVYLASLPDASIGAITSFHMIEHIPFDRIIALLDEGLRILRRGGVLILETPNPGNLAVGASTFYLDPTHIRPVPSQLLRFVTEARGFCDVEVRELHPYPDTVRLPEETAFGRRFNECFYGPQDYALIARRP